MRRILFLCCILSFFLVKSQNKVIDSLKNTLGQTIPDSVRAFNIQYISLLYLNEDIDSAFVYADLLLQFGNEKSNDEYVAKGLKQRADAYVFTNQYDLGEVYLDSTLKVMKNTELSPSAVYTSKGILFRRKGDLPKALKTYLEGIKVDEESNNSYGKFLKLNNIANIYAEINELDKAAENLREALALTNTVDDERVFRNKGLILNNLGTIYAEKRNFQEAIEYFKDAVKENLKNENKKELGRNYQNLGATYEKNNQILQSLNMLKKAISIREEFKDTIELIETNMQFGSSYGKIGKIQESTSYFDKALDYAKDQKNDRLIAEVYEAIANNFYINGSYQKAADNLKLQMVYKDSLLSGEKVKEIAGYQVKYETEKKNKELAQQSAQLQEQENTLLKRNNQIKLALLGGGFLLLGGIGIWLYSRQRQKLKDNRILALKNEQEVVKLEALITGEEKERVRLAQDLHDGINGDLSVIKYKISNVDKSAFSNEEKQEYKEAITMLDNAVEQVRRISHNLAPPSLHNFDLIEAIKQYCTKVNTSRKVSVDFQYYGDQFQLNKEHETAVYRMIQEMLNNIVKHAEASEALVQLNHRDDHLHLTVEDNGKGFNIDEKAEGMGLKNIRSRADFLKADLDVSSGKNGTTFGLVVELDKLATND